MASTSTPRIIVFKTDTSIAQGIAVKAGHAEGYVAKCAANTDRSIGINQTATTASGDLCEIALPGGGALMLLSETVAVGNDLVPHTDGSGALPNASGDEIVARAMKAGAASDLCPVEVYFSKALASQS